MTLQKRLVYVKSELEKLSKCEIVGAKEETPTQMIGSIRYYLNELKGLYDSKNYDERSFVLGRIRDYVSTLGMKHIKQPGAKAGPKLFMIYYYAMTKLVNAKESQLA